MLPGKYMGAIMFGNGISGIAMNVLRIIFILIMPEDSLYLQAQIFFVIAALILFASAMAYKAVENNEFYLYYKNLSTQRDKPPTFEQVEDEEI